MGETRSYNLKTEVGEILYPGKTEDERARNRLLLCDYDYDKYVEGLTGYAGQNLQQIARVSCAPAVRVRIGERGYYKAGLARRKDGALVAAPCAAIRGQGPYDVTFVIYVYESKDEGLSWNKINQTPLYGKEPALICLPDGALLLTAQPIVNNRMGYSLPVSRSEDGGITWSTRYIDGNRDYPRNLFLDHDGSVCFLRSAAVYFEFEENYPGCTGAGIEINRSYDGGLTWRTTVGEIDEWDYPGFMELSALRLPSGKLIASLRHQPSGTKGEGFENTLLTYSEDNGAHWTKPVVVTNTGEVHFHMTLLSDDRLLATYSNYHLPFGVCAMLSEDEGKTWSKQSPYQLAVSADYYVGWGVTCELPDQSLITSYASTPYLCEPSETTVCEAVRWRL